MKKVHLHRHWNSGLVAWSGGGLWTYFARKTTRQLQQLQLGVWPHECEGQHENFYGQTLQREEGAAGSAGGSVAAASPMSFSPGAIAGLTFVSAAGAAQFTGAPSARAELQSKGKHGGNSFRLEPGNCHRLSIPHVMTAYSKWTANQSTAKKAPFWFFFEELKKVVGTYPPV